jgi:hypothetical protein
VSDRNLTIEQIELLRPLQGDPSRYYLQLARFGDDYSKLAIQVVGDEPLSGGVARAFAESVGNEAGVTLDADQWRQISRRLAEEDFGSREIAFSRGEPSLDLSVTYIRDYHVRVLSV